MGNMYECIKAFVVDCCDDDGCYVDDGFCISKGSKWRIHDDSWRLIGGDIRLESDSEWIEISKETFEANFKEVHHDSQRYQTTA